MSVISSLAFLTGSVGTGEWIVLFVVVLIVVGPKRLPEIARKFGRTMEMFRRAADEFKDQIMTMDQDASASQSASSSPPDADGVTPPDSAGASDPYSDAYPGASDYPGNEEHVENWPSSGQPESASAEPAGSADGTAVSPEPGSEPEKPAEGAA